MIYTNEEAEYVAAYNEYMAARAGFYAGKVTPAEFIALRNAMEAALAARSWPRRLTLGGFCFHHHTGDMTMTIETIREIYKAHGRAHAEFVLEQNDDQMTAEELRDCRKEIERLDAEEAA